MKSQNPESFDTNLESFNAKPNIELESNWHYLNNSDIIVFDKFGDNKMTYDLSKIKNPQHFFLEQQNNYYCAELYIGTTTALLKDSHYSHKSLYDNNDNNVLSRLLEQQIRSDFVKLEQLLTKNYSQTNFLKTNQHEMIARFLGTTKNPKSSVEEQKKQELSSFLQLLIKGAILFRRSFETIGIHYEFTTQMRLNRDIAKMYKKLASLNTNLNPFI